jgi:hypothetical protein
MTPDSLRQAFAEDDDYTGARKERAMHDLLCSSLIAAVLSRTSLNPHY